MLNAFYIKLGNYSGLSAMQQRIYYGGTKPRAAILLALARFQILSDDEEWRYISNSKNWFFVHFFTYLNMTTDRDPHPRALSGGSGLTDAGKPASTFARWSRYICPDNHVWQS